jgi:hypothetical protein
MRISRIVLLAARDQCNSRRFRLLEAGPRTVPALACAKSDFRQWPELPRRFGMGPFTFTINSAGFQMLIRPLRRNVSFSNPLS